MAKDPSQSAETNIAHDAGHGIRAEDFDGLTRPAPGACAAHVVDVRREESNAEYHADETYRSCSRVKTFLDSPHLYYKRHVAKILPPYSSDALDHGTLLHRWLEEGDRFLDLLVSPPAETLTPTGLLGKEAAKWAEKEAPKGATVVSPKERAKILAEVAAIWAHPAARELIEQVTHHEVSFRWETTDGHRLKCRADAITENCWLDLKTTSDECILAEWPASVLKWRYHLQDAWYQAGMEAAGLEPVPLRFIVVSTSIGHDVEVVTLPHKVVAEGRRLMERALADLRLREELDWWLPDHHGEVVELEFPAYLLRKFQ